MNLLVTTFFTATTSLGGSIPSVGIVSPATNKHPITRHSEPLFHASTTQQLDKVSTPNSYHINILASHKKNILLNNVISYSTLLDGWDGDNSLEPSACSISNASAYLESLALNTTWPNTMLNQQGEVGLYWDTTTAYIDINFEANNLISVYARSKMTQEELFFDEIELLSLSKIMTTHVFPLLNIASVTHI